MGVSYKDGAEWDLISESDPIIGDKYLVCYGERETEAERQSMYVRGVRRDGA